MREDTPSRTAQWVAAARGLGMLLPADIRLVEDPYGVAFSSRRLATLLAARRPEALARVPGLATWVAYMQVRSRVIDDAVRAFLAGAGAAAQVVLLGAGYDTRALRLPELAEVAVFEVDHPATQRHKRATLDRLGARSPARYVTWDFEARPLEELGDALAEAGHDPARPTLTIWEGVTMYLSEPAIDASLRAIAGWSAAGSQLALTYLARAQLARPSLTTRLVQAAVATLGEPWRWSCEPDELPPFLAARGWRLEDDVATSDAARALLPPELARLVERADRRIAFAVVMEGIALASRQGAGAAAEPSGPSA